MSERVDLKWNSPVHTEQCSLTERGTVVRLKNVLCLYKYNQVIFIF